MRGTAKSLAKSSIPALFILPDSLPSEDGKVGGLEIKRAVEAVIDPGDEGNKVECVQRCNGVFRVILWGRKERNQLLIYGLSIRGISVTVYGENPLSVDGQDAVKLFISNVDYEIPDFEVLTALKSLGIILVSNIKYEMYRDEKGKLLETKNGRRFVFIARPTRHFGPRIEVGVDIVSNAYLYYKGMEEDMDALLEKAEKEASDKREQPSEPSTNKQPEAEKEAEPVKELQHRKEPDLNIVSEQEKPSQEEKESSNPITAPVNQSKEGQTNGGEQPKRNKLIVDFFNRKSDSQASQTSTQKEISVSGKSKESVVSATSGVCSSNQSGSKATATFKDTLSEMNENKLSGASVQTPSNMSIETGTEEMDVQPVVFSDLVKDFKSVATLLKSNDSDKKPARRGRTATRKTRSQTSPNIDKTKPLLSKQKVLTERGRMSSLKRKGGDGHNSFFERRNKKLVKEKGSLKKGESVSFYTRDREPTTPDNQYRPVSINEIRDLILKSNLSKILL